jgi:beta-hydroxyacyl-ACP dehydratase FabZ
LTEVALDVNGVLASMPHRYPFVFVDRILHIDPGVGVRFMKNVTVAEPVFQGHFPGRPILPGVIIVETMAQGSAFMFGTDAPGALLVGIDRTKFIHPVTPGDTVIFESQLLTKMGELAKVRTVGRVDDRLVVTAEITYRLGVDLSPMSVHGVGG